MTAAIRVHHVNKRFRRGEAMDSLRDVVAKSLRRFRRRPADAPGRAAAESRHDFWAVDDVTFEVSPGEAFGVIGPNGAGKSTLLKLLAGIMPPTRGEIDIAGRVSALIELGAGFHGDLTGRENIYLNASILGLSRRETAARFDDIVAFAGIGEFLDTPVKRYSSGMHARLGFAVAAHVEPQVLLVDEVLSVGDRAFRARCMDKMREFLRNGVAIVFVSHDLGAVQRFCDRAMVMSHGRSTFIGPAVRAVGHYWDVSGETSPCAAVPGAGVRFRNLRLNGSEPSETNVFHPGEALRFEFDVVYSVEMARPSYGLSLIRLDDQVVVFETSSARMNADAPSARPGEAHHVCYEFLANVVPGAYAIGLHVREATGSHYAAYETHAARIVIDGDSISGGPVYVAPRIAIARAGDAPAAAVRNPLCAGAV
ncbi:Teichoic acids export ATP-binding protein TagH [Phycisphaerae bacterium RAS2]|nr:Teichoic acids export ATP-binding protein TagH [Phycisphaerae bacterium RAS2]